MEVPEYLIKLGAESIQNQNWLNALPGIVKKLEKDWNLEIGDPYLENVSCSYVAPCKMDGHQQAVLKIGLPHAESRDEIDGLIHLNGIPTVKIYRYDKRRNAMLLEQCIPGTHLKEASASYQDDIICELLNEFWKTDLAETTFRPLSEMVAQWNSETLENLTKFPNADLALKGCQLKEELIASTVQHVFLATDLHAGNVLRSERKVWLAIDIKPYVGDPAYDLTQHLMNSLNRLSENPRTLIAQLSKRAGVDEERLRKWVVARLFSERNGIYQNIGLKLNRKK